MHVLLYLRFCAEKVIVKLYALIYFTFIPPFRRSAAELLDQGHPAASAHCALAKKVATDQGAFVYCAAIMLMFNCNYLLHIAPGSEVCNDALQMLGGYGYLKVTLIKLQFANSIISMLFDFQ